MGKPTALTDALAARIVEYTLAGVHVEVACQAVGISRSTYYLWLAKGKADADRRDEGDFPKIDSSHTHEWTSQGEGPAKQPDIVCWCGHTRYSDFVVRLLEGEAKAEMRISAKVQGAFDQDPRLALYFMERRWPKRWARRDRLALSTDEQTMDGTSHETEEPLAERLGKMLAVLERAGRLPGNDSGNG